MTEGERGFRGRSRHPKGKEDEPFDIHGESVWAVDDTGHFAIYSTHVE
jgi:hypothetical protein